MSFLCCNFKSISVINPIKNPVCEYDVIKLEDAYNKLKVISDVKSVPYFSLKGNVFYGLPCNIYDGDTFSVIFEYKGELIKYRCRCNGYDCAEMKPSLNDPNRDHEKELAIKAKDRLIELLNKHETKLIRIECLDFDKYGRLLINFWNNVDKKSINEIMILEGHGKPYNGGSKERW